MNRPTFSLAVLLILSTIILGACTLPSPATPRSPTATTGAQVPAIETVIATLQQATQVQASITAAPPAVTSQAASPATPTQMPPTPTSAPATATQVPAATATNAPQPSNTPSGPAYDPYTALGNPTFTDQMTSGYKLNWAPPETQILPDTENIRLQNIDDKMYVTGKIPAFNTWWFSWPSLTDFYIELTVDTEDCVSEDAYGLILRGPEHKAGVSYGYIVALTCNGSFFVNRLDSAKPYQATTLIAQTKSDRINDGARDRNILGVRVEGKTLTIYANGYQVGQVTDEKFTKGRYGLFVRADPSHAFTYRAVKLAYWDLKK